MKKGEKNSHIMKTLQNGEIWHRDGDLKKFHVFHPLSVLNLDFIVHSNPRYPMCYPNIQRNDTHWKRYHCTTALRAMQIHSPDGVTSPITNRWPNRSADITGTDFPSGADRKMFTDFSILHAGGKQTHHGVRL